MKATQLVLILFSFVMFGCRPSFTDLCLDNGFTSNDQVRLKHCKKALQEAGLRDKVKVMVGGAPVTPEFAEKIGADGHAQDAGSASRKALELIGKK